MKKWDLIIIIVLIILSLMPIRLLISSNNSGDLKRVIISVNGEEYESLELKENLNKIIKIEEGLGAGIYESFKLYR